MATVDNVLQKQEFVVDLVWTLDVCVCMCVFVIEFKVHSGDP